MTSFSDISPLGYLGGGALIGGVVLRLVQWLLEVWRDRIAEAEKVRHEEQYEVLIRRRDLYSNLAKSLGIFVEGSGDEDAKKTTFLETYDEAMVWCPDVVIAALNDFILLLRMQTTSPGSVSQDELKDAYVNCLEVIRKDAGFPESDTSYQFVSFLNR